MTDVWQSTVDEQGYPGSSVKIFRGTSEVDVTEYGIAGGNMLIVLGEEEKLRRRLAKAGKGILEFANRMSQNMPDFEPGFIARARFQRR